MSKHIAAIDTEEQITMRAAAFGGRPQIISVRVDTDGEVRVWDSVAGYWTTCHSLGKSAVSRARRMAAASCKGRRATRHVHGRGTY